MSFLKGHPQEILYAMLARTRLDLILKRTYQMNVSKRPAISGQKKYFELRILTLSQHNFVFI